MPVNLLARQDVVPGLSSSRARTGHALILATKSFAHDNTLHSWWCILSTAILLVAAVTGTLWHFHPAIRAVCSVISGLLILRFFVIYHDQQHHAILPKSRLAEGLMRVFGILALSRVAFGAVRTIIITIIIPSCAARRSAPIPS